MDVNWIYWDDHFAIYANAKSLLSEAETNTMLCQLYFNFKKKKKGRKRSICLEKVLWLLFSFCFKSRARLLVHRCSIGVCSNMGEKMGRRIKK